MVPKNLKKGGIIHFFKINYGTILHYINSQLASFLYKKLAIKQSVFSRILPSNLRSSCCFLPHKPSPVKFFQGSLGVDWDLLNSYMILKDLGKILNGNNPNLRLIYKYQLIWMIWPNLTEKMIKQTKSGLIYNKSVVVLKIFESGRISSSATPKEKKSTDKLKHANLPIQLKLQIRTSNWYM